MREHRITLPTVGLIAGTRVALGIGLGLLLAERLPREQRQACGWTMLAIGALTTIPLAIEVLNDRLECEPEPHFEHETRPLREQFVRRG